MQTEPGTLAQGRGEGLLVTVAEQTYYVGRDDIHNLLFYGQSVPLLRHEEDGACSNGAIFMVTFIDGHITVHASGRAVIIMSRAGRLENFVRDSFCNGTGGSQARPIQFPSCGLPILWRGADDGPAAGLM